MSHAASFVNIIRGFIKKMDWQLLVFLLLFLHVKIIIKLLALVFIYFVRPNLRFGFFKGRLPLFYLIAPAIGILNYFIYQGFANINYSVAVIAGLFFWMASILAIHQVKLSVERSTVETIHNTITVILICNVVMSFVNLLLIDMAIGEWNPYTYQGMYQKYFIGTGDYIKGISFDTSTTNAVINSLGIFYFLNRQRVMPVLVCMTALLLACSNFVNIITMLVLVYCFLFQTNRVQKSVVMICIAFLVIFMSRISPQNNDYALRIGQRLFRQPGKKTVTVVPLPVELRPDSVLLPEEQKYKLAKKYIDSASWLAANPSFANRPLLPVANIHSAPYQHRKDSSEARWQAVQLAIKLGRDTGTHAERALETRIPGKLLAIEQTGAYFKLHPARLITGLGMGRFSSKLAFRTTGLSVAGGYPRKYIYTTDEFLRNHFSIFLDYFDKDSGLHSIANTPNNVYIQMVSEYGIMGLVALFFFYFAFFARGINQKSYAMPAMLVLICVFFADYWFEQLSVVILFELFQFLAKKESSHKLEICG